MSYSNNLIYRSFNKWQLFLKVHKLVLRSELIWFATIVGGRQESLKRLPWVVEYLESFGIRLNSLLPQRGSSVVTMSFKMFRVGAILQSWVRIPAAALCGWETVAKKR